RPASRSPRPWRAIPIPSSTRPRASTSRPDSVATMATTETPIELVRRFCAAWADGDLDALMAFFADDAVYHNIPVAPVTGKDDIRNTIAGFTAGVDKVEF